ncbi:MAG: hypothetical protein ACI4I6_04580, partial [Hominimerdicola sp.]
VWEVICLAYSDNKNFNAMQEEAIKRVREMQKRSRSIVEDSPPEKNSPKKNHETSNENNTPNKPQSAQPNVGSLLTGLLGGQKNGELFNINGIKIDEEKALIGMLIYILYKQGADVKLLLGLGYLLL